MDNNSNKNSNNFQTSESIWIEGNGVGYCLTEEDYNNREKEIEEYNKKICIKKKS